MYINICTNKSYNRNTVGVKEFGDNMVGVLCYPPKSQGKEIYTLTCLQFI